MEEDGCPGLERIGGRVDKARLMPEGGAPRRAATVGEPSDGVGTHLRKRSSLSWYW